MPERWGERDSSFGQVLVPFPIGISDQMRLYNRDCRTRSMVHEHYKMRREPSILRTVLEMDVECKVFRSSADHIYRPTRRREAPASAFQYCAPSVLSVRIIEDPNAGRRGSLGILRSSLDSAQSAVAHHAPVHWKAAMMAVIQRRLWRTDRQYCEGEFQRHTRER